ncbi:MAG: hypothetical protein BJG00_006430 [Limnothrix sp. CACIAM 69d]|nr:MAG: hypothetical protein BJG00_006430 [Limnothrix sp. CACIAM 69d]
MWAGRDLQETVANDTLNMSWVRFSQIFWFSQEFAVPPAKLPPQFHQFGRWGLGPVLISRYKAETLDFPLPNRRNKGLKPLAPHE